MRIIAMTVALFVTTPALADPSINVTGLDCERVQAMLRGMGFAILHFQTSDRTRRNYDRFVSDQRYCDSRQSAVFATVPTADRKDCPVRRCEAVY